METSLYFLFPFAHLPVLFKQFCDISAHFRISKVSIKLFKFANPNCASRQLDGNSAAETQRATNQATVVSVCKSKPASVISPELLQAAC